MESITDENYEKFKNSPRAALLVSTSWCQQCKNYLPIFKTLAEQVDFIRFGKIVLDKDRSIQLKKEYPDIKKWILPSTIFFKEQRFSGKIQGMITYPGLVSNIQEYLLLGTRVFVQGNNGIYIPASIRQINKIKEPYLLELEEDSDLGEKGTPVHVPIEKINWGLESKL